MNLPDDAPGRILIISLKDKPSAYYSYMPFFEQGGFFVSTADAFEMGEEVLLVMELLDYPETFFLRTRVGWLNPSRTSNGQPQGIGLVLGDDESAVACRQYIEEQLPGLLHSDRATYTM